MKKLFTLLLVPGVRNLAVGIFIFAALFVFSFTANAETEGYYTYTIVNDEAIITKCDASINGDVDIPSMFDQYKVTGIDWYAFRYCTQITGIKIPDTVTSIGRGAFYGCTSLTHIDIPNSVHFLQSYAFRDCSALTTVTIPEAVEELALGLFYNCTNLKSVTIPPSLTSIARYAFSGCTNLSDVYFIGTAKEWDSIIIHYEDEYVPVLYANIHYLKCGEQLVWSIRNNTLKISGNGDMFDYNVSETAPWYNNRNIITSVIIENGVTSIGDYAFYDCGNITNVFYGGTEETWTKMQCGLENSSFIAADFHCNKPFGDADGNGKVTVYDAITILRVISGISNPHNDLITLADINGDCILDVSDSIKILKYVARITDSL